MRLSTVIARLAITLSSVAVCWLYAAHMASQTAQSAPSVMPPQNMYADKTMGWEWHSWLSLMFNDQAPFHQHTFIFFDRTRQGHFASDFKANEKGKVMVSDEVFRALTEAYGKTLPEDDSAVAFIPFDTRLQRHSICPIALTKHFFTEVKEEPTQAYATMIHEGIHCLHFQYVYRGSQHHDQMYAFLARLPGRLPSADRMSLFAEVVVAATLKSWSMHENQRGMIARTALANEMRALHDPGNETPNVSVAMNLICTYPEECPTHIPTLLGRLVKDKRFLAAVQHDFERMAATRYAASRASR